MNSPTDETALPVVHRAFEAQVRRSPDATALRYGDRVVTYAQLNAWANAIARRLQQHGACVGDKVGLYAARSGECIAAMLGILKSGAAYVPLEANLPAERLRMMAGRAASLVLSVPPLTWELSDLPRLSSQGCDKVLDNDGAEPPGDLGLPVSPDDLFYIPYTSGSTGTPKGVEVPHRAVRGIFEGTDYGAFGPGSTVLHHSALSWDGHLVEIYPALLTGGSVWVFPGDSRDPTAIVAFARRHRISTLGLPTQAFNTVVSTDPAVFDWLPSLIVGGEVAHSDHLARALEQTPQLRISNVYGPVECTLLATAHRISREDLERSSVPIGREVGDRRLYVLDDNGELVAPGDSGEGYIGGPAVARGYLGQPRLTAERFVPDPYGGVPGGRLYRTGDILRQDEDGVFEFLGREDEQIKLRGFRIELGEVDAALRSYPSVSDAVTVLDGTGELARLIGYVIPVASAPVEAAELRHYLEQRLPPAMIPSVFVAMDKFPTTDSGKLDRRALPKPPESVDGSAAEPPQTPTEQRIIEIWRDTLHLSRAGRHDDFFEVGGNSLVATRLVLRLRAAFGVEVQVRHIYETPVIAELATLIDGLGASGQSPLGPIRRRLPDAGRRPSPNPGS